MIERLRSEPPGRVVSETRCPRCGCDKNGWPFDINRYGDGCRDVVCKCHDEAVMCE